MKMEDIRKKATSLKISSGKIRKKSDLIHAIQKAEGFAQCFGKSDSTCPYVDCCWRQDCLP